MQVGEVKVQFIPGLGHDLGKTESSQYIEELADEIMWIAESGPKYFEGSDFSIGGETSKKVLEEKWSQFSLYCQD